MENGYSIKDITLYFRECYILQNNEISLCHVERNIFVFLILKQFLLYFGRIDMNFTNLQFHYRCLLNAFYTTKCY